jgi:Tol biopolymer transport system component
VKNAVVVVAMLLLCVFRPLKYCSAEGGGQIAFVTTRDGSPEIYITDSDGANQRRLTFDLRKKEEPAWSPDGGLISYSAEDSHGNVGIYVIDTDGGNQRQLTNSYDRNVVWSPDERAWTAVLPMTNLER